MTHILKEKEERKLWEHNLPRREGNLPSTYAKILGDGVKEKDLCVGTRRTGQ